MATSPVKTIISLALVALLAYGIYSSQSPNSGPTIYTAKAVITMDENKPRATAIAIADGKIIGLGDINALSKQFPEAKLNSEFDDQFILPGFIENHLHPAMAALLLPFNWLTPFDWTLPGKSVQGIQGEEKYRQALQQAALGSPKDEWFISWGYHHYFHGEMSRQLLDELIPDQPALVWHRSFHEIYVNSAALAQVQISEAELEGQHHVDIEAGHFYESGLELGLAKFKDQIIQPMRFMDGLNQVVDVVHGGGITTIADMAMGMFDLKAEWLAMKWVLDDSDTPFRTRLIPMAERIGDDPGSAEALKYNESLLTKGNEQLKYVKQIKLLADGAFYSQLMQMREPGYLDGHHGEWITKPERLEELASAYWQAGYQLHIHTNGDLGTQVVLDMIQRIYNKNPREDHRTTLHHLGYIGPDQAEKIAELNVLVSANPYYLHTLGEKYAELGLGPERAHNIFRARDLVDRGISLSLHSDFSMAPAQPLRLAWVAVNRQGAGGEIMAPEQALTMQEALRAITIDAAYAIQMESEIGSLEVGKSADMTILKQDPFATEPMALKDIPIWGTVYRGQLFPLNN